MTEQTYEEFVNKEIDVWGIDYIADLFDNGYEPTAMIDDVGKLRWTWLLQTPVPQLVNPVTASEYK